MQWKCHPESDKPVCKRINSFKLKYQSHTPHVHGEHFNEVKKCQIESESYKLLLENYTFWWKSELQIFVFGEKLQNGSMTNCCYNMKLNFAL